MSEGSNFVPTPFETKELKKPYAAETEREFMRIAWSGIKKDR